MHRRGRLHHLWSWGRVHHILRVVCWFILLLPITWGLISSVWTHSALVVFQGRCWLPPRNILLRGWHRGSQRRRTSGFWYSSSLSGFRTPTLIEEHLSDLSICRIGESSQRQWLRSCHHRESDTECSFRRCFHTARSHCCRFFWWYPQFWGLGSDQANHVQRRFWGHLFLGSPSRGQFKSGKSHHQWSRCNLEAFRSRAFIGLCKRMPNCRIFCWG